MPDQPITKITSAAGLNRKQREALAKFGHKWARCPMGIHISTLSSLIDRKVIVWKAILPFVANMGIVIGWKAGYQFRLAGKGRKNIVHRLERHG